MPDEMLAVSGPMLDSSSKAYAVIAAHEDDLKALYKRLQTAHAHLSEAAQPKADRVKEIILVQATIDARHDAIIRGIWAFFDALIELVGATKSSAACSRMHPPGGPICTTPASIGSGQ